MAEKIRQVGFTNTILIIWLSICLDNLGIYYDNFWVFWAQINPCIHNSNFFIVDPTKLMPTDDQT